MRNRDITPHRDAATDSACRASAAGDSRCSSQSGSAESCLSENVILSFMYGQASEAERVQVEAHLDQCTACAELVFAATEHKQAPLSSRQQSWPAAFAEGDVLSDRFTIWRFIARGGMGEVYEAFDRKVPERVALKTVLSTLSDNYQAVRHLCEEVKLARRVAHRHVCRIHELHEHREEAPSRAVVHFLAMEFVDGETLQARLARGPLPAKTAGHIARQLLQGLGAAHAAGVLHLDFKSQNVMLRAGVSPAEAVIMDFSLSRALEAETRRDHSERHIVGSPGYMSPEQLGCRTALGPASDVYSFGVVLFEMLTGRLPFHRERAASMMALQLDRPPPLPSQVLPGLTRAFDSFVATCLARDPADRFPDASSALAALDRCLARPLDRASRSRQLARRCTRALLALLPIALGAALSQLGRAPSAVPAAGPVTEVRALAPAPVAAPGSASSEPGSAPTSADRSGAAVPTAGPLPSEPAAADAAPTRHASSAETPSAPAMTSSARTEPTRLHRAQNRHARGAPRSTR